MPTYVYQTLPADGTPGECFEVVQSMQDKPLEFHPESGLPVRRVILAPNLTTRYSTGATKQRLENNRLEKAGFTKYARDKLTGEYHRVAGKEGPDRLVRPGP